MHMLDKSIPVTFILIIFIPVSSGVEMNLCLYNAILSLYKPT